MQSQYIASQMKMEVYSKSAILKKIWGFNSFRDQQEQIIDTVLEGKDTLALMATGGGKSLCYQVPGLLMQGITIVVSPLIALMEDQEKSLSSKGISAVSIHSGKSKKIQDQLFDNCIYSKVKFLFLSPEKLNSEIAIARIKQMNVAFFVIDEAHCISQWGHDFRPSYLKVDIIKNEFPDKNILALTATATEIVVKDIIKLSQFASDYMIFNSSFYRPNISISVQNSSRKLEKIFRSIRAVSGSKIVYARNKRHCREISSYLTKHNISSKVYHADIAIKERLESQLLWIDNKVECIVCTSAFGMGIDKADVRLVIHYDVPPTLEEYIQEIGRAGRDGEKSYAMMLYTDYDLQELQFHYLNSRPTAKQIKNFYRQLTKFPKIPIGGGRGQSYSLNLHALLEHSDINIIMARSILKILEKNEYIRLDDLLSSGEKMQVIAGKQELNSYLGLETSLAVFTQHLLRTYEGLLYGYVNVSLQKIAKSLEWNIDKVYSTITEGVKQDIFRYSAKNSGNSLTLLTERLPESNLSLDGKSMKTLYKAQQHRYESMLDYLYFQDCRALFLLAYFGEIKTEVCGFCDNCLGAYVKSYNEEEYNAARHLILEKLLKGDSKLEELIDLWPWNKQGKMRAIIQHLSEGNTISYTNGRFSYNRKGPQ